MSPGHRVVVERDQPADDLRGEDEHDRPGDRHRDDARSSAAGAAPPRCSKTVIRPSGLRALRMGTGRVRRIGRARRVQACAELRASPARPARDGRERRVRPALAEVSARLLLGREHRDRVAGRRGDDGASNSDTTSRSSLFRCCCTRLNSRKPLPDLPGDLGHLVGAEDEQRDHEDHEDLGRAERGHRGFLSAGLTRRTA